MCNLINTHTHTHIHDDKAGLRGYVQFKHTHTHTHRERMTRMTRPDCAVMCNLINTHTHTHRINASGIE